MSIDVASCLTCKYIFIMLLRQAWNNLLRFIFNPSSGPVMKPQRSCRHYNYKLICTEAVMAILLGMFVNACFSSVANLMATTIAEVLGTTNNIDQLNKVEESIAKSWELIIFAVLIGPIIEEIGFRFSLKITPVTVFVSVFIMSIYTLGLFMLGKNPNFLSIAILISSSIAIATMMFLATRHNLKGFYRHKGAWVVFCSFLFALAHLGNIDFQPMMIIPYIFQFFPFLFLGMCLAYFRIRYGLVYSIALHMLNNFIAISSLSLQ